MHHTVLNIRNLASARLTRLAFFVLTGAGFTLAGVQGTQDAIAQGGTRSLTIYHAHTKEQETVTYKRSGSFDSAGLQKLNWLLRDWRQDEPTRMDPVLFDILWEVHRSSGSSSAIHVVSAYRSPGTNAMLARRSRGVARNSQHMSGRAVDFNIPDVSVATVRDIGLRLQNGGVGYYPRANNPWVHLDTGGVRHWPKVTREHLVRLFPDERTVHIPRDGKPLAGFETARAIIEARGGAVSSGYIEIASGRATGKTLFQILFGGGEGDDEDVAPARGGKGRTAVAARQRAAQQQVAAVSPAPDASDGAGSAIAFYNQNSATTTVAARTETPASQAGIRARPTRPTPLPEAKKEDVPAETKREEPAREEPPKTVAVAALAPTALAEKTPKLDDPKGKWVTVALPIRRPRNLAPSETLVASANALPAKPLDSLAEKEASSTKTADDKSTEPVKPIQVASIGRLVMVPLPVARPSNLPSPAVVGLRTDTASPTPAAPASQTYAVATVTPEKQTAASPVLSYAPTPSLSRIIPAAPVSAKADTAKPANARPSISADKKALDALISQVATASSASRSGPVAPPSLSSVAGSKSVSGKFEARDARNTDGKGFSGSAIRPLSTGFKSTE